jgi:hypothetical protein
MKRAAATITALLLLAGCSNSPDSQDPGAPAAEDNRGGGGADTPITPLPLDTNGVLGGNTSLTDLPAGEPGQISAVRVSDSTALSGSVPFIFRNNTDETIAHVNVTATIRDADGKLAASGDNQGTAPAQIPPGGLGMSYLYIGDAELPADADIEFTFSPSPADTSPFNTGDLTVTELEPTNEGIVGVATNQTDGTLSGPYSIWIYCFDDNAIEDVRTGFGNEDADTPPGGTVSFSERLPDGCTDYLVGVTGYFTG